MNLRLLKKTGSLKNRLVTARCHVVFVFTEEILRKKEPNTLVLESEHRLCQRFDVSRVTARLALGDLEHRGSIFRQHSKSTFAHGRSTHIHRHIDVLLKVPQASGNKVLTKFSRGVYSVATTLRSAIILISQSSEQWQPEFANALSGAIIISEAVRTKELERLQNLKLPFLVFGDSPLRGPRILASPSEAFTDCDTRPPGATIDFFAAGQFAAEGLSRAALTGQSVTDFVVRPVNSRGAPGGLDLMGISSKTFHTQKAAAY